MKQLYLLLSSFILLFVACDENERMIYEAKPALYFPNFTNTDSLNFSFTMVGGVDESKLIAGVKLLGQTLLEDKAFRIVVDTSSTAIEGVHYEPFGTACIFPKNIVVFNLPITLIKAADLSTGTVSLNLRLVSNENFDIGYENKTYMQIRITNRLVKPSFWDSNLALYLGVYSKVKHQKAIDVMEKDFPLKWATGDANFYMLTGRAVCLYFSLNPTMDENGVLIEPWPTF